MKRIAITGCVGFSVILAGAVRTATRESVHRQTLAKISLLTPKSQK